MADIDSVVLKHGFCEECGVYAVSRFYSDGSFKNIIPPCRHEYSSASKITRTRILEEIEADKGRREA